MQFSRPAGTHLIEENIPPSQIERVVKKLVDRASRLQVEFFQCCTTSSRALWSIGFN